MTDRPNTSVDAKRTQRLRAFTDAVRILPFLAMVLFGLPLSWAAYGNSSIASTSAGWVYVFTAWILLIFIAAFISKALQQVRGHKVDGDEKS